MSETGKIDLLIYSFAPFANSESKVLILGTIPGKESLRMNAFYAHPQNAFWKIIFQLYNVPFSKEYQFKKEVLLQNGIALWDVLRYCERRTSLDADIKMEMPNDLHSFLSTHPGISKIYFNGKSAQRYFNKFFSDLNIPTQVLPSTSPAYTMKWEQKLSIWQVIKTV